MKIIKHGNRYSNKAECKECRCVFIFEENDIIKVLTHCSDSYLQFVRCPECGKPYIIYKPDGLEVNIINVGEIK